MREKMDKNLAEVFQEDDVPMIDEEQIEQLMWVSEDGGADLLQELLELFINDNLSPLALIDEGLDNKDFEIIARQAHSIGGSSANLGGRRLSKVCLSLEKAAKEESLEVVRVFIPKLKHTYQLTIEALREEIAKAQKTDA